MTDMIRVHNQGEREYTIPPSKPGGKERMLQPNRAFDIEEKLAKKLMEAYPQDLIDYDTLVVGSSKRSVKRENAAMKTKIEELEAKLAKLEAQPEEKTEVATGEPAKKPKKKA